MAIVKCEKGHFYDNIKYKNCPHCENGLKHIRKETYCDDLDNLQTQFFADPFVKLPYTEGVDKECDITVNLDVSDVSKDSITVGLYNFNNGTQLLVGWLVEVKGVTKGKDYKLFTGWNRIGRSQLMDIYIPNDKKISANNHGAIVFDEKNTQYYFINENGSLSYVNGVPVVNTTELHSGDSIRLGDTELIFMAFCTKERKWEDFLGMR